MRHLAFPALRLVVALPLALAACASHPAPVAPAPPPAPAPIESAAPAASTAATPVPAIPSEVAAAVAAPDRSDDDKKLDAGRKPAEMLAFFGIHAGERVAELEAAGGYTTELLARSVGPTGVVYGQNNKFLLDRYAQAPWTERLKKPAMKGVVRVDRELEDPLPPEAKDLDAVILNLFYHDTVWIGTDRPKMNAAVFAALKKGGVYGIVDHSSRPGAGLADVQTLHRIEESVLKSEVEAAGFKLAAEGDFLRNPADTRDWSTSPKVAGERRGTSDRFVLKFVKP